MRLTFLVTLSALSTAVYSAPSILQNRDVSSDELSQFKFWVQYAAASYCYDDYTAQVGNSVSCSDDLCPQVEATGAKIVYAFSNTTSTDTAGYIARDDANKAIILAFRGSYSVRNWVADIEFPDTDPGLCDAFLNKTVGTYPDYELVVTGHSLGAGIATLAAADLRGSGHPSITLFAFASPRVANPALADYITAQNNNYRFTHINDPVPKLPLLAMGYVHVSPEYYITSPNNVTVTSDDIKVLEGEVNWEGNTGTGAPSLTEFPAHHWYFEEADGCKGSGLPWKI
ncbi:mono and diacylglycerol lipase precursor [Penicillium malachiteum]|nr:mono and diacylglycerol lipase precursor [Penicillium malachiteum]